VSVFLNVHFQGKGSMYIIL